MADEIIPEKTCTKCGIPQPITNYHKAGRGKYGVTARCKTCVSVYDKTPARRAQHFKQQRAWRERHGDAVKERERQRYQDNREYRLAQVKAYNEANRDQIRERFNKYYQQNKEAIRKRVKEYEVNNREAIKTRGRFYRQTHKDQVTAANRAWRRTHPTHRRLARCRRRGRKAGATGTITLQLWLMKCEYHGYRCYLCGKAITGRRIEMEHRVPLSRGGSNWIANIAPSCKSCNSGKCDLTEREYRDRLIMIASQAKSHGN